MFFDSFSAFIEMGGHGLYVWMAYSIALAVVAYNIISPIMRKKQFISEQQRRLRREKQLAERQTTETAE